MAVSRFLFSPVRLHTRLCGRGPVGKRCHSSLSTSRSRMACVCCASRPLGAGCAGRNGVVVASSSRSYSSRIGSSVDEAPSPTASVRDWIQRGQSSEATGTSPSSTTTATTTTTATATTTTATTTSSSPTTAQTTSTRISDEELDRLCSLAKLRIDQGDKDRPAIRTHIAQTLEWVSQIQAVPTADVRATLSPMANDGCTQPMAGDISITTPAADILANAKGLKGTFFAVPEAREEDAL
eukprot:TRINITY_DN442_c0_g1_i1.p1 TRINITY_DN442_c0_g1~~TRINITY_DN442_c0_g1_i1.p1  ORF type:complete len:255 (-),score=50.75 TRINITY_DN442_c0_g1_i1:63-779(-)